MYVSDGTGFLVLFLGIGISLAAILVGYSAISTQSDLSAIKSLIALVACLLCFLVRFLLLDRPIPGCIIFSLALGVLVLMIPLKILGLYEVKVTSRKYNLLAAHTFAAGMTGILFGVVLWLWKGGIGSVILLACTWGASFLCYSVANSAFFEFKVGRSVTDIESR